MQTNCSNEPFSPQCTETFYAGNYLINAGQIGQAFAIFGGGSINKFKANSINSASVTIQGTEYPISINMSDLIAGGTCTISFYNTAAYIYNYKPLQQYGMNNISGGSDLASAITNLQLTNIIGVPMLKQTFSPGDLYLFQNNVSVFDFSTNTMPQFIGQSIFYSGAYIVLTLEDDGKTITYYVYDSSGKAFNGNTQVNMNITPVSGLVSGYGLIQGASLFSTQKNNGVNASLVSLQQFPMLLFLQYAPTGNLVFGKTPVATTLKAASPTVLARPDISTVVNKPVVTTSNAASSMVHARPVINTVVNKPVVMTPKVVNTTVVARPVVKR